MSNRIQELVEQANETILLDVRGDGTIDKEVVFSKEKFAELIIKECVDVIYDGSNSSEWAKTQIYRHFGINSV